ncbi:MAG: HAD family hydrolase [Hyphomicrobiales bacterium]
MTSAIFWDNDGVLVDTERLYYLATRDTMATIGFDLTREQYVEYFLVQGTGAWHLAAEGGLPPEEVARLRADRNERYGAMLEREPLLIDGVRGTLEALHGRYRMGIVTSSRRDHFDTIHARTGLLPYFDFVLAEGDYARTKPDPAPYRAALERSGLAPERCVVVEDSRRGLLAAVGAGLRCLVIPSEFTRGSDFTGAWKVLDRIEDVVPAVNGAAGG